MCRICISQRDAIKRKPFSKGLIYSPNRELCAANAYRRRIDGYRYYPRHKKPIASRKCPFCPKFRRIKLADRKKDKEIRYGRTDSCGGDSGGPLLDLQGRLIGIHSSIGISLSENRHAPISAFKDQWKLMQRGKVVGRLYDWNRREQGFLGIQIDPQSETADVLSVVEGSPAQISGIRKGDRIVILDGRPVRHGRRFLQRLRYFKPNDEVTLEVKRAVSYITESLTIKLKRRSDFLNEPNR